MINKSNKKSNSRPDFRINNIAKSKPRKISELDFSGSRKSEGFSRRSQEEMVGFVLIVVLVTIIALVFLAISLRKAPEKLPSAEIESFMQSAMKYSTDCYTSAERRYDMKDLIKACSNSEKCMDNRQACDVLNETLSGMFKEAWKIGDDAPVKAYEFKAYEKGINKTIIRISQGNCAQNSFYTNLLLAGNIGADAGICT